MQCSQCGQQQTVTVNGKTYCGSCGNQKSAHVLNLGQDKNETTPSTPKAGNVLDLSDIPDKPAKTPEPAPPASVPSHQLHSPGQAHTRANEQPRQATPEPPEAAEKTSAADDRLTRAGQIEKSQHITRFGNITHEQNTEEPAEQPETPPLPTPIPTQPKANVGDEIARRHVRAPQAAANQQTVDFDQLDAEASPGEPLPQEPEAPPLPIEDTTDDGKPNFFKRLLHRPRLTSATAAIVSILLLAGYVTYLNMPNIALRVAASRAGFSARMPNYMPGQYDFSGPVAYGPGQIVVNFSGEGGQRVVIAQRQTDLDSASLLENHIEPNSTKPPLTFHERGLTIYIYNGNKASWVNRGIWYSIEGNHNLNAEQIIRIATSL